MTYMIAKAGDTWSVMPAGYFENKLCIATDLNKLEAIKLCHFMNGGGTMTWEEVAGLLEATGNLDDNGVFRTP